MELYPKNDAAPAWVTGVLQAVADAASEVATVDGEANRVRSDEVLRALAPGLEAVGFVVESGKRQDQKIARPVLYGDNGEVRVKYEIDGWHPTEHIALEVEAGRGAANNADCRDIVRASLLLDARYLCLVMPIEYRSGQTASRVMRAYAATNDQLGAIYASQRLRLPFDGVLLIGY